MERSELSPDTPRHPETRIPASSASAAPAQASEPTAAPEPPQESAETSKNGPPLKLNALEEAKRVDGESPQPLNALLTEILSHIPGVRSLLELKKEYINFDPRNLYFNTPIPQEEIDPKTGKPKAKYATNKVRTTKYTPLNFLPKNIIFQFRNVANIYFLMVAILAGFSLFGVSNAGLASVPIIAIVVVTALRDGFEDWRRHVLDLELNDTVAVVLANIENENSPPNNVDPWRRFKKACSRFYRKSWNKMRRRQDTRDLNTVLENDNQSITSGSLRLQENGSSSSSSGGGAPAFEGRFWKDVRVGDIVKVYADQSVPADMVVLSSSDPEGDCFIDTRSLDGETSLKPRRAIAATRHLRRAYQIAEQKFSLHIEGTNSDLNSFGWTFNDLVNNRSEPIGTSNFLPRGSTVRNSRWVIGYVVYTGIETKIVLNAGETPTKRSRLARDLNFYVACNFIYLFLMCFVSGVVEGCKFRQKDNIAYFFDGGLQTKNAALNGFVTFFAAMLVLQNLVPISLYISIEIARTCLAFFIYSDCYMYDEETDYPCTPKSWALSDDLGQIEFVFSDKTGTLTQNSMVFRKCSINGKSYGIAFTECMAGKIKREGGDVDSVRAELEGKISDEEQRMWHRLDERYANPYIEERTTLVSEPIVDDMEGGSGHTQSRAIEQFALVLALCNTVVTEVKLKDPEQLDFDDRALDERRQLEDRRRSARSIAASVAAGGRRSGSYGGGRRVSHENNLDLPMPPRASLDLRNPRMSVDRQNRNSVGFVTGPNSGPESAGNATRTTTRYSISGDGAPRQSVDSARTSLEARRIRSRNTGVYGGAGRKSFSSARPKHNLDYHDMRGKVLLHKAESPDESALVSMARDLGFTLVEDGKHHKVVDNQGKFQRYEVLQTILFTSHRKRMSIVVKDESDRYFVATKGADSIMADLLTEESRNSKVYAQTLDDLDAYGRDGLRTLMIGVRELDGKFAEDWSKRFEVASAQPNRDDLIAQLAEEVEYDLTLLGGTGIEDQLQDDVPNTIEILSLAGIKLWMLTGDKVETAISIGFSCNLLNPTMELLIVTHPDELAQSLDKIGVEVNDKTLKEAGNDHSPSKGKYALIVDGSVLAELVSNKEHRLQFALLGKKCKSVLCCRVSPSQKAAVVHIMKSTFDVTTLAIGDGANDVSMIQEADVGVGIVGVEGRQAAMSSDFAIGQFSFLQRLVLVHGRWSYKRVASMINNLLFQNFMFSMTLFWYGIYSQYDQSYLYDYTYLTLFNSLFVSIPVVIRGILDQDLPDWVLLKNPQLYGYGILRKAWTKPKYFFTVIDGIFQSAVTFFFVYSVFYTGRFYTLNGHDIAYRQGMGVLACAVATFVCNTYVLLGQSRWDWLTLIVYVCSNGFVFAWTGIYTSVITSNFFFRSAEQVYDTLTFWAYFLLTITAAMMPRFAYLSVKALWFPSDLEIIKEQEHYGVIQHDDPELEKIPGDMSGSSESEKPLFNEAYDQGYPKQPTNPEEGHHQDTFELAPEQPLR